MPEAEHSPQTPPIGRQPNAPPAQRVIRAARLSDAEAIAALQSLPGYRAGTLRLPFTSPEFVRGWLEKSQPGNLALVAVLDGRVVGNAGLQREAGRRSHAGQIGMGVHDDFVGRGIGRALLNALLDAADNWLGLVRVELTVFVDNAPAVALYRSSGFEIEGTLRAYALRDGMLVNAFAMARLRPSPSMQGTSSSDAAEFRDTRPLPS